MVGKVILPRSITKRLISTLMCSKMDTSNEAGEFQLKSSSEFASRKDNVFKELAGLEKNHQAWMTTHETHECFDKTDFGDVIQPSEKIFKRPLTPPSLKKAHPSTFKRNPKKWKKYSLVNVPLTSDATNAAVAFEFFKEQSKQNLKETNECFSEEKVIFSKPKFSSKEKSKMAASQELPSKNSETEYECKTDTNKMQPIRSETKVVSVTNVKLDHLQEYVDEPI